MKYVVLLVAILISMTCQAEIYMQQDQNGDITYSDTPLENAQVINTTESNNISPAAPTLNVQEKKTVEVTTTQSVAVNKPINHYTIFTIMSPKDQENIQNQPTLPVNIKIEPALQPEDSIQLMLDGKVIGSPSHNTHIELGQLERGIHQLKAFVVDANQKIIQQSDAITIYVNRVNVNFSPALKPVTK